MEVLWSVTMILLLVEVVFSHIRNSKFRREIRNFDLQVEDVLSCQKNDVVITANFAEWPLSCIFLRFQFVAVSIKTKLCINCASLEYTKQIFLQNYLPGYVILRSLKFSTIFQNNIVIVSSVKLLFRLKNNYWNHDPFDMSKNFFSYK